MKKRNIFLALATVFTALPVMAEDGSGASGLAFLGAGLTVAIAALGGALGQGKAVSSAMDGIARNPAAQPKLFVPLIIGLAFMETLVIFSWVIAFQLLGKI